MPYILPTESFRDFLLFYTISGYMYNQSTACSSYPDFGTLLL